MSIPDVSSTVIYPSIQYPYDPYEPYDPYDPYPYYICDMNEDEYGRPYYGPYDEYLLTYQPLYQPFYSPCQPVTNNSLNDSTYNANLRLVTNQTLLQIENQTLSWNYPSCIISNECNQENGKFIGLYNYVFNMHPVYFIFWSYVLNYPIGYVTIRFWV